MPTYKLITDIDQLHEELQNKYLLDVLIKDVINNENIFLTSSGWEYFVSECDVCKPWQKGICRLFKNKDPLAINFNLLETISNKRNKACTTPCYSQLDWIRQLDWIKIEISDWISDLAKHLCKKEKKKQQFNIIEKIYLRICHPSDPQYNSKSIDINLYLATYILRAIVVYMSKEKKNGA